VGTRYLVQDKCDMVCGGGQRARARGADVRKHNHQNDANDGGQDRLGGTATACARDGTGVTARLTLAHTISCLQGRGSGNGEPQQCGAGTAAVRGSRQHRSMEGSATATQGVGWGHHQHRTKNSHS
jgi:hypothetical protein